MEKQHAKNSQNNLNKKDLLEVLPSQMSCYTTELLLKKTAWYSYKTTDSLINGIERSYLHIGTHSYNHLIFDRGVNDTHWGKVTFFNKHC